MKPIASRNKIIGGKAYIGSVIFACVADTELTICKTPAATKTKERPMRWAVIPLKRTSQIITPSAKKQPWWQYKIKRAILCQRRQPKHKEANPENAACKTNYCCHRFDEVKAASRQQSPYD